MKKFGKMVTFVTLAGAAVGGLWYFLKKTEEGDCACKCREENADGEEVKREYVSLNKFAKAVSPSEEAAKETEENLKEAAKDAQEAKDSIKKAVKSVAQDLIKKAEDKASGIGVVKEESAETDGFSFEKFDEEDA